jgi:hypothetical protein
MNNIGAMEEFQMYYKKCRLMYRDKQLFDKKIRDKIIELSHKVNNENTVYGHWARQRIREQLKRLLTRINSGVSDASNKNERGASDAPAPGE